MEEQGNIVFLKKPKLRHPHMVCGISGWVDGGEASTGSVRYLVRKLKAKRFAEIPIDKFHIFQMPGQPSLRPQVRIEDGILKEHRLPQNQFSYCVNPNTDNDLILFLGTEPNLNWQEYVDSILNIAKEFAVARIYLLGGVLDKTPHTREPSVSCTCSSKELKEEMGKYGVRFGSYEGPGTFGTTLLHICQNRKLPVVSIMTRATYYPEFNIAIPRNPRSISAVISRLNSILSLGMDISDLDREAAEIEVKLGTMASHDPKFQAYIEDLEKDFIEVKYQEPLDISADEAIRLAEELLKKRQEG
jgi:proteasome assembly chaperone (PAC2) family protein